MSSAPGTGPLLCIVPNPSIDRTEVVDRLVVGTIHRPIETVAVAGGKGLNVARAARALGEPVEAALLLAGDAGRWIDAELTRLRLPHRVAWGRGETRTCISVLDRSTGQLTELYEAGPAAGRAALDRLVRLVRAATRASSAGRFVALSGSLPAGADPSVAGELVRLAAASGARVVVDMGGAALVAALAGRPAVVKVNAAEAATVVASDVADEAGALVAARLLVERGAAMAIVTRGALGAVAWDGTVGWAVDAPPGGGLFSVGAGDAFLAGLTAGLRRREPLEIALRRAAGAAAASTLEPGPGNLDGRVARDLARQARVRRVG